MQDRDIRSLLDGLIGSKTPGLQYLALSPTATRFEYNAGYADIQHQRPMEPSITLNAYSMSKTITAAAILILAESGTISLDDPIDRYLGCSPYGPLVTIRQLVTHTSGIPNPIPLRWVHPVARHAAFDENAALQAVLRRSPRLSFDPGHRFAYSNIGYWLLGELVASVTGCHFTRYVSERVLQPLGITQSDLSYVIPDFARHAEGYLEKYSLMNVFKRFLIDGELIGGYEGTWVRIKPHYVDGPAFGGLIGSSRGFGYFLQDQLRAESKLFSGETRSLFYSQQRTREGTSIPMTLGWHIGTVGKHMFYFKEGGGGGFRSMMRVYPASRAATVVMTNATGFDAKGTLDAVDSFFL